MSTSKIYLSQAPFSSSFCEHFLLLLFVELTKLKVGATPRMWIDLFIFFISGYFGEIMLIFWHYFC